MWITITLSGTGLQLLCGGRGMGQVTFITHG